jgi:xylulokinase
VARVAYSLDQSTPDEATIALDALAHAIETAARQATERLDVAGIGVSCLTPGLVLLDAKQRPVLPVLTHLDRQARPTARNIWQECGTEFLASIGNKPLPGGISAIGYLHHRRLRPEMQDRVRHYLHINGWLALRWTGQAAFDRGNASFTGLFDTLGTHDWSPRWCNYFQVDRTWLPEVRSGDEVVGGLLPEVAERLGVRPGIPVKLGAADTSCAMLAAGMQPGDVLHVVGTTQVLACLTDHPAPSEHRLTRYLGVGPAFIQVAHNPVGGVALDWLHQLCFRDQSPAEFYQQTVIESIGQTTPVVLDPPFLGGDRLQIEPRLAAFNNLALNTDRLDLLRALLTGMRHHHEEAIKVLGAPWPPRRIFLTGGGADLVARLIPEYADWEVVRLEEGSLRGVATLFR